MWSRHPPALRTHVSPSSPSLIIPQPLRFIHLKSRKLFPVSYVCYILQTLYNLWEVFLKPSVKQPLHLLFSLVVLVTFIHTPTYISPLICVSKLYTQQPAQHLALWLITIAICLKTERWNEWMLPRGRVVQSKDHWVQNQSWAQILTLTIMKCEFFMNLNLNISF